MTTTIILLPPPLECLRCGHKWIPRIKEVTVCPKCKSPYWNHPKSDLKEASK